MQTQPPMAPTVPSSYDSTTVILHWITAALVVLLWLSAQVIDVFPNGPARVNMRSVHITLGVLLIGVLVFRVSWRSLAGARLPSIGGPTLILLARALHLALYALLVAQVLLGLANVWVRGDSWFNFFTIPALTADRAVRRQVNGWHGFVANTILVLAGLHAAAGLWHHYVQKDDVLRRMWPRRARQSITATE